MVEDNYNLRTSTESGLSAWEVWLINKAKEDRKMRRQAKQQKKQEKLDIVAKVSCILQKLISMPDTGYLTGTFK